MQDMNKYFLAAIYQGPGRSFATENLIAIEAATIEQARERIRKIFGNNRWGGRLATDCLEDLLRTEGTNDPDVLTRYTKYPIQTT